MGVFPNALSLVRRGNLLSIDLVIIDKDYDQSFLVISIQGQAFIKIDLKFAKISFKFLISWNFSREKELLMATD